MNKLDICNAAIVRLGSSEITSLTDNNKRAKLCNSQYDRVKKDILANHPWRFALKRAELSVDLGPDPFNKWGSSFILPSDYLRLYRIEQTSPDFTIEGNRLYANDSLIQLQYMADVPESEFRSYFVEVIILKLAIDLSYSLVQSNELSTRLYAEYEQALRNARTYNAQEGGKPQDFVIRDWTDSRL